MRAAPFLLASLFCFSAVADNTVKNLDSLQWTVLGVATDRVYDFLDNSVQLDPENVAMQFTMRTTYKTFMPESSEKVKSTVENVLVLCNQNMLISMFQFYYDASGQRIKTIAKSQIYPNPGETGDLISETIKFACGTAANPSELKKFSGEI
jgi:hypothetical protein